MPFATLFFTWERVPAPEVTARNKQRRSGCIPQILTIGSEIVWLLTGSSGSRSGYVSIENGSEGQGDELPAISTPPDDKFEGLGNPAYARASDTRSANEVGAAAAAANQGWLKISCRDEINRFSINWGTASSVDKFGYLGHISMDSGSTLSPQSADWQTDKYM